MIELGCSAGVFSLLLEFKPGLNFIVNFINPINPSVVLGF